MHLYWKMPLATKLCNDITKTVHDTDLNKEEVYKWYAATSVVLFVMCILTLLGVYHLLKA